MSFSKTLEYSKKLLFSRWLVLLIRVGLGSIFLYAGAIKLLNPKAFAHTISAYGLVPDSLLVPVAIGLPVVELIAGVGLIFAIRGSLSVIFSLLILFILVLWYGILKNFDIDCGCFSPDELKGYVSLRQAFYRDLIMIAAVIYLYISRNLYSDRKIQFNFLPNKKSN